MDIIGKSLGDTLLITGLKISAGKSFLILSMYRWASCMVLSKSTPYSRFAIMIEALEIDLVTMYSTPSRFDKASSIFLDTDVSTS